MSDHENFLEALKATNKQFEDKHDDLEAVISSDIGFHTFFVLKATSSGRSHGGLPGPVRPRSGDRS